MTDKPHGPDEPLTRRPRFEIPQSVFISQKPGTEPFDPERDKLPWFPPRWLMRLFGHAP